MARSVLVISIRESRNEAVRLMVKKEKEQKSWIQN